MDESNVKRAADYLTENHEQISAIKRKMDRDINSLNEADLYNLRAFLTMNEAWVMRLNWEVNTPVKKTKRFWKR